ncbi:MAG: alpha/beta fold hydrolase [Planctomycetes bacterium]|nr:alpha/beta fold hydrolase [Planctomycetota bacterium]
MPPAPRPAEAFPDLDTPFRRSLRARGLQRFLELGGRRLAYAEAGEGPAMLLLHGLGGSAYDWRRNLHPLARRGFRVLAVDLLGAGLSDKPLDGDYSVSAQAGLLGELVKSLRLGRVVLVGNSYGGSIALAFAKAHPACTRALVLIDAFAYRDLIPSWLRLCRLRGLAGLALAVLPERPIVQGMLRWIYGRPELVRAEEIEEYSSELRQPRRKDALAASLDAVAFGASSHVVEGLAGLRVPSLVLWGERDPLLPMAHGRRLSAELKGARFEIVERCGHIPNQEAAAVVNRLVARFLLSLAPTPRKRGRAAPLKPVARRRS